MCNNIWKKLHSHLLFEAEQSTLTKYSSIIIAKMHITVNHIYSERVCRKKVFEKKKLMFPIRIRSRYLGADVVVPLTRLTLIDSQ